MGIFERIGYGWAHHIQGKPSGEARQQARRWEDTGNKVVVAAAVSAVTGGVGGAAVLGTTQVTVGAQVLTAGNVGICAGVGSACGTGTVVHKGPGNLTMKEVVKTGAVAGAIGGAVAGTAISVHAILTEGTTPAVLPFSKPESKDDDEENEKPSGNSEKPSGNSEKPSGNSEKPPPKPETRPPQKNFRGEDLTTWLRSIEQEETERRNRIKERLKEGIERLEENLKKFPTHLPRKDPKQEAPPPPPKQDLDPDEEAKKLMIYIKLWQAATDFDKD